MLHNTTPTNWYSGAHAVPQPVYVLLFNNGVHLYDTSEQLLQSYPISTCSLVQDITTTRVYLTEDHLSYLLLQKENAITGFLKTALEARPRPWFRRLLSLRIAVFLSIVTMIFIGIYFLFASVIPATGLRLISVQQEVQLGKTLLRSSLAGTTVDSAASKLAQGFADQLALSSIYPVKVYVIVQPEANAFALPGGSIVIHSGILAKMKSYEELTALLGHEITHINERHSLRSILRQLSFTAFITVITGDIQGISGAILSNATALQSLSFSRQLETDADEKGMEILVRNHVDPAGMLLLLERLQSGGAEAPVEFLSSHPITTKRMEQARRFIRQHPVVAMPHPALEQYWLALLKRALSGN